MATVTNDEGEKASATEQTEEIAAGSNAGATIEMVERLSEPRLIALAKDAQGNHAAIVLPAGKKLESLKPLADLYLTAPERRKGLAVLKELGSFEAHVLRFKNADSVIFAQPEPPSLLAVYDYNPAGGDVTKAAFGDHRASYTFPLSDAWKAWTSKNAVKMSQADFAAFLEDHLVDVTDPASPSIAALSVASKLGATYATPAKLLMLSRGLDVRTSTQVKNAINLANGETQINFVTENRDSEGKSLDVPSMFLLALPVFRSGVPWEVPVRLRYRVQDGSIVWWFDLYRTDIILKTAFDEAVKHAGDTTGLPVFVGAPESK